MTIANEITRIENSKDSIKASIIAKGVDVPDDLKIDGYYACIDEIKAGGDGVFADVMVIGGGGGGGGGYSCGGGGGGAGGVVYCKNMKLNLPIIYKVGKGGGIVCCGAGKNGGNSTFGDIIAYGGGGGGTCKTAGCDGGSGGGGGINCSGGNRYSECYSIISQGNNGGSYGSLTTSSCRGGGGGGGGASSVGLSATGGNGFKSDIDGTERFYASGGGGFNNMANRGAVVRGGNGGDDCGGGKGGGWESCCGNFYAGTEASTPGSGGGGGAFDNGRCGGKGNTGIIVLRYPTECGFIVYGGCKYTCGDYTIHCMTSGGGMIADSDKIIPGIYHNASQGLITMSSDGTNWLTICDKNQGATGLLGNGCLYQWGNNNGFNSTSSTITSTTTRIDASSYGPGNWYCCSTYRMTSSNNDWSTVRNDNLWGGTTNNVECMQGPMNNGFHIPMICDFRTMINCFNAIAGRNLTCEDLPIYLLMPNSPMWRSYSSCTLCAGGGAYWTSQSANYDDYVASGNYNPAYPTNTTDVNRRGTGYSLRGFKNVGVSASFDGWEPLLLK